MHQDSSTLNRPKDVAVKSDGSIYFTDPGLGRIESEPGEMLTGRRCILRPGLPWVVSARRFLGFLSHVGTYDRLR